MALATGTRLGPYEVLSPLGAGGMGEVYRARDTRLDRTVAIKVLAPDLAGDGEFRQRFHAEARAISQLTHPHICTLHDLGEHEGTTFLVMELLAGETLADRLARGTPEQPAIALDAALLIGIQIADALAAAHAQGIVHRDLKPGNIMLTKAATPSAVPHAKLLDFGLAKSTPVVMGSGLSMAPTTPPQAVTAHGTILGTIQYMAPEQVEDGPVDARSDIFAFGSVLYELVTGQKAFAGKTQASVMAAILEREPPAVSALQPRVPALVEATVKKCLAKNPDERWQSAADLATALRWATTGPTTAPRETAASPSPERRSSAWRVARIASLAAAMLAAGAGLAWRFLVPVATAPEIQRFEIQPPPGANWSPSPVSSTAQLALSPDGKQLALVVSRQGLSEIWVRSLDTVSARPLPGTERASFPFWSPDGRFIAFFADSKLKKVDINGGRPQVLADAPAGRGGAWNQYGVIAFTPSPSVGLFQVSADGGAVTPITSPEETRGNTDYWPQFLPDGQRLLFYRRSPIAESQGIYVTELQSKRTRRLMAYDSRAFYATPGYLLTVRDGMLFAQAFDQRELVTRGEPTRIADSVGHLAGTFGDASVTVSNTGTLAHGPQVVVTTSLQWRDRSGTLQTTASPPGVYRSPRLSPDEKSVALSFLDQSQTAGPDIWTVELARSILTRLTSDPRNDWFPVWSQDGTRIFFGSTRYGPTGLFRKSLTASAPDEALTQPLAFGRYPTDITKDGRLIFHEVARDGYDLRVMPTAELREPSTFLATRFNEVQGRLAPNQRWMAYASDESGRFEVYVRPFPVGTGQWTLSVAGGMQPEWRGDGRELFYLAPNGDMMAVPVTTDSAAFSAAAARPLFRVELPEPSAPFQSEYAVSADGQRFLLNAVVAQSIRPSLTLTLNWAAGLARK